MALIKCPECGKDVSTQAKECPHCGYPLQQSTIVSDKQISSSSEPVSSNPDSKTEKFHLDPLFLPNNQKASRIKKEHIALIMIGSIISLLIIALLWISSAENTREKPEETSQETASKTPETDGKGLTKKEKAEFDLFLNNVSQLIGLEISEDGHTSVSVELYEFSLNAELFGIPGFIQGVGKNICTQIFWNANEELTDQEYHRLFDYLNKIYGDDFSIIENNGWSGYNWNTTGTFKYVQLNKEEENGKLQTYVCFGNPDLEPDSENEKDSYSEKSEPAEEVTELHLNDINGESGGTYIDGIDSITAIVGYEGSLSKNISYDSEVIKNIKVNMGNVNTMVPGTYPISYEITIDVDAYCAKEGKQNGMTGDTVTLTVDRYLDVVERDYAEAMITQGAIPEHILGY